MPAQVQRGSLTRPVRAGIFVGGAGGLRGRRARAANLAAARLTGEVRMARIPLIRGDDPDADPNAAALVRAIESRQGVAAFNVQRVL